MRRKRTCIAADGAPSTAIDGEQALARAKRVLDTVPAEKRQLLAIMCGPDVLAQAETWSRLQETAANRR